VPLATNLFRLGIQARCFSDDDPFWIHVTVLRNYTVHTYNEPLADYVYSRLAEMARRFRAVLTATAER
jgi:Nucleotidyltransferase substrate binding protein like